MSDDFRAAMEKTLVDETLDKALVAAALSLPRPMGKEESPSP